MRFLSLMAAMLACFAVAAPVSAEAAAWGQFVDEELGFAVNMPGEPTVSAGEYQTAILGTVPTKIYTAMDRGVTFTVTLVDVRDRLMESASVLQEVIYIRTRDLNIVSDDLSRSEPGQHAVYGRRVTEDRPDGSRVVAAFYLTKGHLFLFEATIPPGGDKGTPVSGRFVDSVVFNLERDWNIVPGAPAP